MGEQIHVGGFKSSMELAQRAGIKKGMHGIDLCSALGAGCRFLVKNFGVTMVGLDATATMHLKAGERTLEEGLSNSIEFRQGDVTSIPYDDDTFDFVRAKELKLIDTDPNKLVKNVINSLSIPAGISILRDFGDALPHIVVDETQIQRVFINIIKNALEAMKGGGTLTISTGKQIDDKMDRRFVTISFKDTGAGIPKDRLKQIFDPLYTTKSKGTGRGLGACENIIHAHKGCIEVESEVGRETKVTVKLPVKDWRKHGKEH